jgi:peptide/nickel transport system permease protein
MVTENANASPVMDLQAEDPVLKSRPQSWWHPIWRQFARNKAAILGMIVLAVVLALTMAAPIIAPYHPLEQSTDPADYLSPPSWQRLMGTDDLRRDVFSRVLHGGGVTIRVGVISVAGAVTAGVLLGILAGYYGGLLDGFISRFIDVLLALPGVLLAIAVVAILGPSLQNAMLAVAVATTPTFARLVRSVALTEKNKMYVEGARALGASDWHILYRHILPNVIPPIIIVGTLSVASAIQIAAGLSFLGLGAQPPDPEWGAMLSGGRNYMRSGEWWMTVFPGVAIFITVLAINLMGDGLRDALDPRLRD